MIRFVEPIILWWWVPVLGGLVLGLSEAFAAGYISSAYEDVFAFGVLVLILILRPSGLLGRMVKQKV